VTGGDGGPGAGGAALASLSWPDVDGAGAVLAVPVGATEQHGPHLPFTTDTEIAEALVRRLAAEVPGVVAAPAVAYGASGEHQGFPGTLSIGREAATQVLVELARSAGATFARVLWVSTHGGNADAVRDALAVTRAEGRDVRAWSPRWDGDPHAGRLETSLMLALAPDRVALERAVAGARAPLGALLPALRADGVRAVSPNGVLGDPAGASADEGRALLAAAAAQLAAFVVRWRPG
jgi:mycofactocin precursor peptide peptidase